MSLHRISPAKPVRGALVLLITFSLPALAKGLSDPEGVSGLWEMMNPHPLRSCYGPAGSSGAYHFDMEGARLKGWITCLGVSETYEDSGGYRFNVEVLGAVCSAMPGMHSLCATPSGDFLCYWANSIVRGIDKYYRAGHPEASLPCADTWMPGEPSLPRDPS